MTSHGRIWSQVSNCDATFIWLPRTHVSAGDESDMERATGGWSDSETDSSSSDSEPESGSSGSGDNMSYTGGTDYGMGSGPGRPSRESQYRLYPNKTVSGFVLPRRTVAQHLTGIDWFVSGASWI